MSTQNPTTTNTNGQEFIEGLKEWWHKDLNDEDRKKVKVIGAVAGAVLLLVAGLVGYWLFFSGPSKPATQAVRTFSAGQILTAGDGQQLTKATLGSELVQRQISLGVTDGAAINSETKVTKDPSKVRVAVVTVSTKVDGQDVFGHGIATTGSGKTDAHAIEAATIEAAKDLMGSLRKKGMTITEPTPTKK
jgi:hypothetical protein